MRRGLSLAVAALVGLGLVAGSAAAAGAQAGNLAEFCTARVTLDPLLGSGNKKAALAAFDRVVANAPPAVVEAVTELRDGYKKKGDKAFEELSEPIAKADAFVYDNCPGAKVPVTAIDYEYEGVPATLKPGVTQFKLENDAPKENHELFMVKLSPEGAAMDPEKLLSLPEKKVGKLVDFSTATAAFAPPGETGYTVTTLQPGDYVYACFIPQGGKKKGAPHFTLGMYGTFTVS